MLELEQFGMFPARFFQRFDTLVRTRVYKGQRLLVFLCKNVEINSLEKQLEAAKAINIHWK